LVLQADEGQDENILPGLTQGSNNRGAVSQCDAKNYLLRELLLTASEAAANCKIGIFYFQILRRRRITPQGCATDISI